MNRTERLGLEPGSVATYSYEDVSLTVVVIEDVEGWFRVKFSDGSSAIVRPSRLTPGVQS